MSTPFPMIYAQVPRVNCIGKCHPSCGPISAFPREVEYFEKQTGKKFPDAGKIIKAAIETGAPMECPHLNPLSQCDVYSNRPLICRLWGVVDGMPCPWGCKPERQLSDAEGSRLIEETR